MAKRLNSGDKDFNVSVDSLVLGRRESQSQVADLVSVIISKVKNKGDRAVLSYTRDYDRSTATSVKHLRISSKKINEAVSSCDPKILSALEKAASRIEDYHQKQIPENLDYVDGLGIRLGTRWTPLESVGLYTPGGTASYPSSVLMNAIPARVAGVKRLAMVVPAPDDIINPLVLVASKIANVDEIYSIGGAQAVAALAYGTETITPVDKIVGPGNVFVAEAKRQVFGKVGIDMVAGPSEVLIVADTENNPDWIAADLLAQAEHDPSAQSILICTDANFANAVETSVENFLLTLPRAHIAEKSWKEFGAIICVSNFSEVPNLVDRLAPEHLALAVDNPEELMSKIQNAGAIFLGRHAPEALGDYLAGPSHVLPTSGSARFSSGLGVLDFLKRSSIIGGSAEGLSALTEDGEILAAAEGLDAHKLSFSIRSSSNIKGMSGDGK